MYMVLWLCVLCFSRLAAKTAVTTAEAGHRRAEDKSKATAEAMYKECTFAPDTVVTKTLTDKILAAKGKQVVFGVVDVVVCVEILLQ